MVAAKNDSNNANSNAIEIAPINLQEIPLNLPLAKYLLVLSCGSILNEIIPANENIIDNSQDTPIKRMNVVDSLDTDQSGYPDAFAIIALPISYNQCTPYKAKPAKMMSKFFLWNSLQ